MRTKKIVLETKKWRKRFAKREGQLLLYPHHREKDAQARGQKAKIEGCVIRMILQLVCG
jgi:hypothetical protein